MIEYKAEDAPTAWINGLPASGQLNPSGQGYLAMTARDVAALRCMCERGDMLIFRGMVLRNGSTAENEFQVRVEVPPPSQATIVIIGVEAV
jgi:hypothetical protein